MRKGFERRDEEVKYRGRWRDRRKVPSRLVAYFCLSLGLRFVCPRREGQKHGVHRSLAPKCPSPRCPRQRYRRAVGVRPNREAVTRFAVRLDMGKMDIQLIANEEKQDRAEGGKNEAGGMITFVSRARKHVRNGAADNRTDNAEHDRPEDR
jgi:hypothetical protein